MVSAAPVPMALVELNTATPFVSTVTPAQVFVPPRVTEAPPGTPATVRSPVPRLMAPFAASADWPFTVMASTRFLPAPPALMGPFSVAAL